MFVTSPLFSFWWRGLLRFYGVFLKLCVTPCSSSLYPPCPNWTMLTAIAKEMLFNQVHGCLLLEEENVGPAKQRRLYLLSLALGGKNYILSCFGFPGYWVVNACWQLFMNFPAWEEWFFLQFQGIYCPRLFFLLAPSLPCLQVAHSKTLVTSKTDVFCRYIVQ